MKQLPVGTTYPRGLSLTKRDGWRIVRIGDYVQLRYGKALPEPTRRDGPVPIYGSNGQCGWHDTKLVDPPGVVLGRKGQGPLGVEWVSDPFWVIDTAYYSEINADALDLRFYYYLVKYIGLNHLKDGASNPSLTRERFGAQAVSLPALDVQRRLASVPASIDDLIDNNLRRIRLLEELASVLFARFSASAARATVTQRPVADLIKQGLLEVNDGYRAKNDELNAPGLPFARAGNVNAGFQLDDADILHESSVARADRKVSRAGDIVFTSKGTVGRFAYVHANAPRFVYSPQLCFWRSLKPEQLSPRYLYRWMRSDAFTRQVDMVKGSTTMADYVSLGDQKRMVVDVPRADDQKRLDEQLVPVEDSIANLTARNANLRKLRDLLLPKLLSGEIDVSRLPLPPEEPVEAPSPEPTPEPDAAPRRGRRTKA